MRRYNRQQSLVATQPGLDFGCQHNHLRRTRSPFKSFAPNGEETQMHYRGQHTFSLGIGRNGDSPKVLSWQYLVGQPDQRQQQRQ